MSVPCPSCGAANADAAAFCLSCGKSLPDRAPAGPHIVGAAGEATTAAARDLQSRDLGQKSRKAFGILLVVGILQTIAVFVVPWLLESEADKLRAQGMILDEAKLASIVLSTRVVVGLIAAVFFGLAFWARKNPLPAAIAGLVAFVTLHAIEAVIEPSSLVQGWLIKIFVVAGLIAAIRAGVDHRRILAQAGSPPR